MNKKLSSALLFGALLMASTSVFVSCKDYDDDISGLQERIDKVEKDAAAIQTQIQNGAILSNVESIAGGIRVTLTKNGTTNTYEIKDGSNGIAGKDGVVWSIGTDGFWYKDGEKTTFYALGTKGDKGDTGAQGEKGDKGDKGDTGAQGAQGEKGDKGDKGDTGAQGAQGEKGDKGDKGDTGAQGAQGEKGDKGDKGDTGAQGAKGDKGDKGDPGEVGEGGVDGVYYVPNPDTGCFDVYQNGQLIETTNISFIASGAITAVQSEENLILFGVAGGVGPYNSVTITLGAKLKALVFKPALYLDGIESIEYPWIGDSLLRKAAARDVNHLSHHMHTDGAKFNVGNIDDYLPNTLARHYNSTARTQALNQSDEWIYGPVWPVEYHMNPSTSVVTYAGNTPRFNVLEPDVVYYNTRAAANKLNITSPEKYEYWGQNVNVFGASSDGILTVGLKIQHPENLAPWPTDNTINPNGYPAGTDTPNDWDTLADTDTYFGSWYCGNHTNYLGRYHYDKNNKDNTIALQMLNADEEGTITSDYALIVPTRVQVEGLVWAKSAGISTAKAPDYAEPKDLQASFPGGPGYGSRKGDEEGWANLGGVPAPCVSNRIHIWDSPEEALNDPDGAAIELGALDAIGIDLTKYIGVHYVKENLKARENAANRFTVGTWKYGDEKKWGLHYEFEFVDYTVSRNSNSTNLSRDSRYATFSDWTVSSGLVNWNTSTSQTGIVIARTVNAEGKTMDSQSKTAVDREPLVRVMLKNADNKVLLDGYILFHIYNTRDNKNVVDYPDVTKQFDLCNDITYETNWSQFSNYILQTNLNNMEKNTFDDFYWADCWNNASPVPSIDAEYVTPNSQFTSVAGDDASNLQYGYHLHLYNFGTNIYGNGGLPPVKGDANWETSNAYENKELGTAIYWPNSEGTTNHRFTWTLSTDELEYLTHHQTSPITVTRWIKFIAKDTSGRGRSVDQYDAPYPYIWVKMTMVISRKDMPIAYLKNKNDDYYRFEFFEGHNSVSEYLSGYEAVAWNPASPRDAERPNTPPMMTVPYGNNLNNAFLVNGSNNNPAFYTAATGGTKLNNAWKFYFTPIESEITLQNGQTWVVTPRRGSNDNIWNKFMCAYTNDSHQFNLTPSNSTRSIRNANGLSSTNVKADETQNNNILNSCAIRYNNNSAAVNPAIDGVFANDTLFAVNKTNYSSQREYEPIATMNQYTGQIVLLHEYVYNLWLATNEHPGASLVGQENIASEDLLNAFGYNETIYVTGQNPIHEQLRNWTGTIMKYANCDLAMRMSDATENKKDNNTFATWMNGWERPINVFTSDDVAIDAKNNGNYIYAVDFLKIYDWRGYAMNGVTKTFNEADVTSWRGGMFGSQMWLWAYYGIKQIDIKLGQSQTTLHHGSGNWQPLSSVSNRLQFYAGAGTGSLNTSGAPLTPYPATVSAQFSLRTPTDYCFEGMNSALLTAMGIGTPAAPSGWNADKAQMGYIFYTNNGDNVQDFDLRVPVTLHYDWGKFDAVVTIHVNGSIGNND
jgi:hypothetical protein